MKKEDLINELNNSNLTCYEIFMKGYLHHFNLDEEIFKILLPRLIKEATELTAKLDSVNLMKTVSELETVEKEIEEFRIVVNSACFDEVSSLPYCLENLRKLQNKINAKFKQNIINKQNEGFEFVPDIFHSGNFQITNILNQTVFDIPFVTTKQILKEWGIEVDDSMFPLYFHGIFPKKELNQYRLAYCFSRHFKF